MIWGSLAAVKYKPGQ